MHKHTKKTDSICMKKIVVCFICFVQTIVIFGADLSVLPQDIRIEAAEQGGLNLYIRKKEGVNSVLLTETTKDPTGKEDNYTLRAKEWNAVNGNERRVLDGKFLTSQYSLYSITDSSSQPDEQLGEVFHLYIPQTMVYGYPWTRSGEIEIKNGFFINIRTFEKPYADYTARFADNPYVLDISIIKTEKPPELLQNFNENTVQSFSSLAETAGGYVAFSKNPDDLLSKIQSILAPPDPEKVIDIVFAIDATDSMSDDIDKLREEMVPMVLDILPGYKGFRVGLLLYKDYDSDFFYNRLPVKYFGFTENLETFNNYLHSFKVFGGRDYPEAVYEALYSSLEFYEWNTEAERRIILIGDAEPHPVPRRGGRYTKELVDSLAKEKDIRIDAIILFDPNRPVE